MILKSRYVVPVDSPVVENGAVVVRDGSIAAVGRACDFSGESVVDYGDAVICPGFVNAHTHLELSLLHGLVPPSPDFVAWLLRLCELSIARPPTCEQVSRAVNTGVAQSLSAGVTLIGDVARAPGWVRAVLAGAPLRAVSFGEVVAIGKRRGLLAERLGQAASDEHQTGRMRVGISPHAPYTVEPDAMRACAQQAHRSGARLCLHLAEVPDEEQFTRRREGRLADYLRQLDVWDERIPVSGCGPVELARRTGLLGPDTIIAHANYVTDDDITLIARSGAGVAYCPRTHVAFDHKPHRFREMLAGGINVCIGTDSLASTPSLSILDELRFVRARHGDLDAQELVAMATLRGAHALGFGDTAGSITAGKSADLVVVPLDLRSGPARWDSFLESEDTVAAVYVSGVLQKTDEGTSGAGV